MPLTSFEKLLLEGIPKDDFYECGIESELWVDVYVDRMSDQVAGNVKTAAQAIGGGLASLKKKGFIWISIQNDPGRDTDSDNTMGLEKMGAVALHLIDPSEGTMMDPINSPDYILE